VRKWTLIMGWAAVVGPIVTVILILALPASRLVILAIAASAAALGLAVGVALQTWRETEIEQKQICLDQAMAIRQTVHPAELRPAAKEGGEAQAGAVLSLGEVNLRGAKLIDADLRQSDLRGADLRGADLRGADLNLADLRGADLRDAQMAGADLEEAVFDRETRWPVSFDPTRTGAIDVEELQ
jgi:hypothetical protein